MMKKKNISLVLLIIVMITIPVIIFSDFSNKVNPSDVTVLNPLLVDVHNKANPNDEISISPLLDKNWEYVKNRLFDGETSTIYKLKGPILFTLLQATKEDSLLVLDYINHENFELKYKALAILKSIDENLYKKLEKTSEDESYNKIIQFLDYSYGI